MTPVCWKVNIDLNEEMIELGKKSGAGKTSKL
jgi:hypothetical protein